MKINPTIKIITKIACLILVIAALFSRTYQPIETEDIWWHLKAGEWINENRTIPIKDPFPFEPNEKLQTFTQMYSQWLGSLTFYKAYQFWGEEGLKLFRSFIFFLTFLILFLFARRKMPFALLAWLIFLTAPALESRSFLRPLMFNFIFVQLMLILLFSYERNPKRNKLFFLLPIGALWSNLHLGSFVYGTTLLTISVLANFIGYARNRHDPLKRQISLLKTKELMTFSLLYWLMFGINPTGIEALLHNWKVFLDPSYIQFSILDKMIMELQSPGNIFQIGYLWLHIIFMANLFLLWRVRSDKKFYFTIIYITSIFFFLYAIRGSDFAILLQFYIAAEMSDILNLKTAWKKFRFSIPLNAILLVLITTYACASVTQTLRTYAYQGQRESLYITNKIHPFNPSKAVSFLRKKGISGPIFADDLAGGYLIWHTYPHLRPFTDGRQTNMDRFFFYISAYDDPERNWEPLNKRFHFSAILLINRSPEALKLIQYFQKDPSYLFAHYSNNFAVFIRKDLLDSGSTVEIDQNKILLEIKLSAQEIETLQAIFARKSQSHAWFLLFKRKYAYIEAFEDALFLYNLGYREAAAKKIIEAAAAYSSDEPLPILMRILAAEMIKESVLQSEVNSNIIM